MKKKEPILILTFFFLLFCHLFYNLGERPLFGVEGRWAEAAREMSLTKSWFVPTINFEPYTTKPLIPFWLIKISGEFFGYSEFSVRLPGSLLALFSVFLFYLLSLKILEKKWALIATLLYTSSLGFLEFSRLAQSEIYQLFGIVSSLTVYVYFREKKSFLGYFLFTLALLFGALSKGLTAVAVLVLFLFIDITLNKRFYHLNWKLLISFLIGIFLYFLPYYLTSKELNTSLPFYLWFRENIKQAVEPYDNLRPFYIYFFYLPLWVAPFTLFLLGAFYRAFSLYRLLSQNEKLFLISLIAIFILFTLAQARRGYYILPILPFSILLISLYLQNSSAKTILKIYRILSYFLPLLTLSSLLILLKLNFSLSSEIIFITLCFFFIQILLFFYSFKSNHILISIILIFFSAEVLFYTNYQPEFSKSTEKLSGEFVYSLKELNNNTKICYVSIEKSPVANFYFYAKITEKVPKYDDFYPSLRNCNIVVIRKTILEPWIKIAKEKGFKLVSFENPKEKSKSYYIFYHYSTLKTPFLSAEKK